MSLNSPNSNDFNYFFILDKSLLDLKVTEVTVEVVAGLLLFLVFFSSLFPSELSSFFSSFSAAPLRSLRAEAGTLGVLTGSIGEFVLDRLPKNLEGFSGPLLDSNFARPLATAPAKNLIEIHMIKDYIEMQKPLGILIPAGKGWLTLASLALVQVAVAEGCSINGGEAAFLSFKGEVTALVSLLLLVLPMVTPLLNTWVTLSMTLPLIMLDMLARAAGCLAAAHTGFLRRTTPPSSEARLGLGEEGSKAMAPCSLMACSLFPFNLSLSDSTSFGFSLAFDACDDDPDLKPSECIRREISFEARSTTLLVEVLMLMSNSDKHHGIDSSQADILAIRCFGLMVTSTLSFPWLLSLSSLGLHTHTAAAAE